MGGFSLAYFFKPSQPWFDVPTTKDKNNIVLGRGSSTMPPQRLFQRRRRSQVVGFHLERRPSAWRAAISPATMVRVPSFGRQKQ